MYYVNPKSGHTYIALKPAAAENGINRQDDTRQLSASVPASGSRGIGSSTAPAASTSRNATALFADDTSTDDTDSDGQGGQAGPSRLPTVEKSAQAGSTWAMQPPKEQQAHHKEVANASTSPQKRDRFTYFGPRRSEPTRSVSTASQQPQQASEKADELGNRRAAVGAGAESDNDEEEDLLSAIRESLGAPSQQNVTLPPVVPIRKQPASLSAAAIRETVAEYGLDEPVNEDLDMSNVDSHGFFNEGGNATFTPSRFRDDAQDQYGEEIPFDQIQPQAGPSQRRPDAGENDNEDSDFDMDAPVRSHQRTSSGGGSARKEVPDIMLDGYKATRSRGRSARPGPPGMDETSTRDSSVQDADSQEGGDLDDDADDKPDQDLQLKPTIARRGPTKPGTLHRQSSNQNDDSSDDDVVVVTSVRVGAPPAKSKEDREAEWQARQAKRKEREARRLEKEKSSLKRKRNPLPNFRNTQAEEAKELKAAYEIYLNDLNKKRSALEGSSRDQVIDIDAHQENETMPQAMNDLATVAEENASWTQVFSYESAKGRGTRPDYNTVKFWPYNLPFPGRLKDEAIVAVAGGCVVSPASRVAELYIR